MTIDESKIIFEEIQEDTITGTDGEPISIFKPTPYRHKASYEQGEYTYGGLGRTKEEAVGNLKKSLVATHVDDWSSHPYYWRYRLEDLTRTIEMAMLDD